MLCLFQVLHLGGINFIIPIAFPALLKSVSPTVTLVGLNILVEVVVELVFLEHHPPKNISAPSRLMRSQKKFKNLHIHNVYLSFSSAVRSNLSPSKATFMIDTTDPRFKFFCLRQLLHTDQRWRPKPNDGRDSSTSFQTDYKLLSHRRQTSQSGQAIFEPTSS